jgi:membrane-bound lytic murein transglycosylase B
MGHAKQIHSLTIILVGMLVFLTLFSPMQAPAGASESRLYFESLQKRLINDGFDRNNITKIYLQPQVKFDTDGLARYFIHREASLNYDQFASPKSIQKAKRYMQDHRAELEKAERVYGVNGEIITAIALVETRLGTYVGKRSVLNTLSTLASLSDPAVRNRSWDKISTMPRVKLTRNRFEKWSARKSKWAYKELKAFLQYSARENFEPAKINGSYAGAMGISQFMPSNIQPLARDGNSDGRIDLFDHADAIASIANYLKRYGWRPGLDREKQYQVLLYYNRSKYYANILLKIAKLLEN